MFIRFVQTKENDSLAKSFGTKYKYNNVKLQAKFVSKLDSLKLYFFINTFDRCILWRQLWFILYRQTSLFCITTC